MYSLGYSNAQIYCKSRPRSSVFHNLRLVKGETTGERRKEQGRVRGRVNSNTVSDRSNACCCLSLHSLDEPLIPEQKRGGGSMWE